ncbi:MAG: TlpA family protein disulfide reductase [Bacteroidaceae bacterium]|nr:TlpA family protein disulfide reductase [Bacteroidaceae bacterium]
MKKRLFTILFALTTMCGFAQEKVWEDVVTGYRTSTVFDVKKVWFYPDRTDVLLHIDFHAGFQAGIALGTTLDDGVNSYALKGKTSSEYDGAMCVEYDVPFVVPASGEVDILLSFEPLPANTERFTLDGRVGWVVQNIRSAADLPAGITDTYWRNNATGDWLIGFAEKQVIYDSRFWDIKSMAEKRGGYTLTVVNGDDVLGIKVGKMKKGIRTIKVNGSKAVKCSPITTATLPDYPVKDNRVGFKDNGYRMGDSVTIIGWLKDMPAEALERGGKEFEVSIENIISCDEENYYAQLDSIGRFVIKIPVMNSTQAYLDWRRSKADVLLEPGETYLFLNDFTTGQQLFMGKDVRLQNEMLGYPFKWFSTPRLKERASNEEAMMYLEGIKSELGSFCNGMVEYTNERQNLSRRCVDFVNGYYQTGAGRELMQGKFYVKDALPAEYFAFVRDSLWCKEWQKPYTMYRNFPGLLQDYIHYGIEREYTGGKNYVPLLKGLARSGVITLNERELAALESYDAEVENVRAKINSLETDEEKKALATEFNAGELVTTVSALLKRYNKEIKMELYCGAPLRLANSITDNACLRDICVAYCMYRYIEDHSKPLNDAMVAFLQQNIAQPAAKKKVLDMHEKYLAIMNREISSDANLMSSKDVADMSDGEKILRKLVEPYKGKIILIDVWGTWCGPCRQALSHSKELYERMAQYNIVFLYLANRSDEDSWKNVIKEYNVTGDNVVHYNLPGEQQSAVENFLKVNGYPTYRLIDRNGNLLDVNADPRNLDALENLLKAL